MGGDPDRLAEDLAFAHRLADLATEVALAYFERGVDTLVKHDGTPVSEADLEVDRRLLARIGRERSGDSVLSEESGALDGSARRRWILDPIDGTFNFVEGKPAWGTHVALEVDGVLVLGLVTRPSYGLRWWATAGGGAYRGDNVSGGAASRVRVSGVRDLASARVTAWSTQPRSVLRTLRGGCSFVDASLDSCLEVVQGDLDAVVGAGGMIWDQAPAVVLVQEAGGRFDDGERGLRADLGNARFSNGHVDDALTALLAG